MLYLVYAAFGLAVLAVVLVLAAISLTPDHAQRERETQQLIARLKANGYLK